MYIINQDLAGYLYEQLSDEGKEESHVASSAGDERVKHELPTATIPVKGMCNYYYYHNVASH